MDKKNYSLFTEGIIAQIEKQGVKPTLLLQVCCAPCSSYVMEYLSRYFDITLYFYNPNISPEGEYTFRLEELRRLTTELPEARGVKLSEGEYNHQAFLDMARGLETLPEGGERCRRCYALRLTDTAKKAKAEGFDWFTTTLSISPHKNADWLNEIGEGLQQEYGVLYLFSDFKKKNGYKRSIELSRQYNLYRQDYCGCAFSKATRTLEKCDG
ncbi:MAG: epoxyqueuosine reductase QueH [Clostridia bacterium]|nr:epoxyqueuosine reductase QueH [Clostridia bacterium]